MSQSMSNNQHIIKFVNQITLSKLNNSQEITYE